MKIKSNKKRAMALVIMLIIITTLAVIIASSTKILNISDSKFSINRNARGGNRTSKVSGKYICYKKLDSASNEYKLYQRRIDYNPDGSVKGVEEETLMGDNCRFSIPRGSDLDVTIIGGGGEGSQSSYEIKYGEDDYTTNCGYMAYTAPSNSEECIIAHRSIFEKMNIIISGCSRGYSILGDNGWCGMHNSDKKTITLNNLNDNSLNKIKDEVGSLLFGDPNYQFRAICKDDSSTYHCEKSENCQSGQRESSGEPDKNSCTVTITYGSSNDDKLVSANTGAFENNKLEEALRGTINSIFGDELNQAEYYIKRPVYDVKVGMPGKTGEVKNIQIKGDIKAQQNGEGDTLLISKNDIANPGEETNFRYWWQNSNEIIEVRHTAGAGANGVQSDSNILIDVDSKTNIFKSREGTTPKNFMIPPEFSFSELYAGYVDTRNDNEKLIPATYFGASGASGYIGNINNTEDLPACIYVEYKDDSRFQYNNNGYKQGESKCEKNITKYGTKGAPGAILITW